MPEPFHSTTRWATAAKSLRRCGGLLRAGRRPPPPVPVLPLPPRLTAGEQWDRVTGILLDAQGRAGRVVDVQRRAAAQLDAATYGLQRLREEIAPAMIFMHPRPAPAPPTPTAFKRDQFRRCEPIAA